MEGRREGEGRQINNGILSGLDSLPLSLSLSVSVSVSCSGPPLLSQADFIARPWTRAKQASSIAMSTLMNAFSFQNSV